MACELCEHCQSPVFRNDKITIREGFSYHKKCHKCYVCSETNLLNAEVFKGVIFCSGCAQRIFQGCSTARRTKTINTGRGRRTRSRSHRRERERVRVHERKISKSRDGVIELARLVGSNTDSDDQQEQKQKKPSKTAIFDHSLQVERNKRVENCYYYQTVDRMKKDSQEMGTTTDVTQDLLKQINCIAPKLSEEKTVQTRVGLAQESGNRNTYTICENNRPPFTVHEKQPAERLTDGQRRLNNRVPCGTLRARNPKNKVKPCSPPVQIKVPQRRRCHRRKEIPRNKPSCSDLRIAELGMSTEIANMALRKNSEVPFTIRSDSRFKRNPSYALSVVNMESDKSGKGSWVDSAYSTIDNEESETSRMVDRRLGSILKMPVELFRKNILNRSSLVSVLMSAEDKQSVNLFRKIKLILHDEVVEHQVRGLKRLYSTVNRRKTPHKLGWLALVAKVSRNSNICTCSYGKRCKHFKKSHSYRCMRAQVMKLAGPTISELAIYKKKIKRFITPQFLRNMLAYKQLPAPALKLSAACQRSCSAKT